MKKEAFQIQRGDYFLYHGEVVKVTGRSPYNESHYTIENKNGSKFYADTEELEYIVINDYALKQAGISRHDKYKYLDCQGVHVYYDFDGHVTSLSRHRDMVKFDISHFHVLQNALRLFGVEVTLKD